MRLDDFGSLRMFNCGIGLGLGVSGRMPPAFTCTTKFNVHDYGFEVRVSHQFTTTSRDHRLAAGSVMVL